MPIEYITKERATVTLNLPAAESNGSTLCDGTLPIELRSKCLFERQDSNL